MTEKEFKSLKPGDIIKYETIEGRHKGMIGIYEYQGKYSFQGSFNMVLKHSVPSKTGNKYCDFYLDGTNFLGDSVTTILIPEEFPEYFI